MTTLPFTRMSAIEDYRQRAARLKSEQRISTEEMHYRGRRLAEERGEPSAGLSAVQKALAPRGSHRVTLAVLRTIAYGLDVDPSEFPEYRLAELRRLLDEDQVGLDAAVELLEAICEAGVIPADGDARAAFERELDGASQQRRPRADGSAAGERAR